MPSATATKRSPRKVEQPQPRTYWTETHRNKIIDAAKKRIKAGDPLHARELLRVSMEEALPESEWRDVVRIPFSKFRWFAEAIVGVEPDPEPELVELEPEIVPELVELEPEKTRPRIIRWTNRERSLLVKRGLEIRAATGNHYVPSLLAQSQQDVLPPERHRRANKLFPSHVPWFAEAIANAPPLLMPTPPPEPEPEIDDDLDDLDDEPLGPFGLDSISTGDLVSLLARRLYDGMQNQSQLLMEMMKRLDRRQRRDHQLLIRVVADLDPKYLEPPKSEEEKAEQPPPAKTPIVQPAPPAPPKFIPKPPPVMPPPPPPPMRVEAKPINGSLVASLNSLDFTKEDSTPIKVRAEHPRPQQPVVPPKPRSSAPKLKVCVVGMLGDQKQHLVRHVEGVAEVTFEDDAHKAARKGFTRYDKVVITRKSHHNAVLQAYKDVGQENLSQHAKLSASAIADTIKGWAKLHQMKWDKDHAERTNGTH